jgi:hypothetical protein
MLFNNNHCLFVTHTHYNHFHLHGKFMHLWDNPCIFSFLFMGYKIFITFFFFFFFCMSTQAETDSESWMRRDQMDIFIFWVWPNAFIYIYIYIKELGVGQGHHLLPPNSPLHTRKRERIIRSSDLCFIKHGS